jgi:hypothetical protein
MVIKEVVKSLRFNIKLPNFYPVTILVGHKLLEIRVSIADGNAPNQKFASMTSVIKLAKCQTI